VFQAAAWTAPPQIVASAVPPAPVAPPLPFIALGKKLEDGEWEVFLGRGDQVLLVREGQSIDTQYRVDQIQPPILSLTYLPLNKAQTLSIGDAR
jgi:hypothetical protein